MVIIQEHSRYSLSQQAAQPSPPADHNAIGRGDKLFFLSLSHGPPAPADQPLGKSPVSPYASPPLNRQDVSKGKDDKQPGPPSPANASLNATSNRYQSDQEEMLLEQLRKLRKENQKGHNQTKMSLERLEQAVADIKDQIGEHEERIGKLEERVGNRGRVGYRGN